MIPLYGIDLVRQSVSVSLHVCPCNINGRYMDVIEQFSRHSAIHGRFDTPMYPLAVRSCVCPSKNNGHWARSVEQTDSSMTDR